MTRLATTPDEAAFAMTRLGTTMRLSPSANHLHGLHLLGRSPSLLAQPWWTATLPGTPGKPVPPLARPQRPLTPFMQYEMSRIAFHDPQLVKAATESAAASEAEERRAAMRRAKYTPGPKVLRISRIKCEDLPDADKGMGGGTADPYVTFKLSTDRGDRCEARTETLKNAPRDVRFPDVLDLPVPDLLLRGKCNGTLVVQVWDDDSFEDGQEGVNGDDLMGHNAYQFNCRLRPYKLEGYIDRATYSGIGSLYAFRVSFQYEAVPAPSG